MNLAALFQIVKARLEADTGAAGLFPDGGTPRVCGVFNNYVPPTKVPPYIVIDMASAVQDDAFACDMVEITMYVSVFAPASPGGVDNAQQIIDRVYGDGVTRNDRVPTYGLHRWQPVHSWDAQQSTAQAWGYTTCHRTSQQQAHGDGYYHFIEVYGLRAWKDAPIGS